MAGFFTRIDGITHRFSADCIHSKVVSGKDYKSMACCTRFKIIVNTKPYTSKEEQTMNKAYTIFSEILKLCPRYHFDKAVGNSIMGTDT